MLIYQNKINPTLPVHQRRALFLPDNRPRSVVQRMAAQNHSTAAPSTGVVQLGKLRDHKWVLPSKRLSRKFSRAIRSAERRSASPKWKRSSKRNILLARFVSKDGKQRYNLVLRSAGMGGKHPIGIGGRSAGHTEPQLAALLKNPLFRKSLDKKLKKGWYVAAVFSSNQPCSSPGGGSSEGCGGMESSSLGSPSQTFSTSTGAYSGGQGVSLAGTLRGLREQGDGESDGESSGSDDDYLEENDVRGTDLTKDHGGWD